MRFHHEGYRVSLIQIDARTGLQYLLEPALGCHSSDGLDHRHPRRSLTVPVAIGANGLVIPLPYNQSREIVLWETPYVLAISINASPASRRAIAFRRWC